MSRGARSYLVRGLAFGIVLEGILVPALLLWPEFFESIGAFKTIARAFPIANEGLERIEAMGVEAYVAAQHYFKGCNALGMAACVLFAMGAVAGEAQRGTLELWLSRPVSRRRLLTERYVGGALAVIVPVFLTSLTIPWLLTFIEEEMGYLDLMRCSVHMSLFLLALYSMTFLLSALTSDPARIALGMLFFVAIHFALYLVKTVTHYSLFRLTDIGAFADITSEDRLDWGLLGLMLGVSVACFLGAQWAFQRRVP